MKQLIYRIENEAKQGFFQAHKIDMRKLKGLYKNPSPIEDKGINRSINLNEKCGFLDDGQLNTWIRANEFKMIMSYGFKLKRIYREVTSIGQYQVLYKEGK